MLRMVESLVQRGFVDDRKDKWRFVTIKNYCADGNNDTVLMAALNETYNFWCIPWNRPVSLTT